MYTHSGRSNERERETEKAKVKDWTAQAPSTLPYTHRHKHNLKKWWICSTTLYVSFLVLTAATTHISSLKYVKGYNKNNLSQNNQLFVWDIVWFSLKWSKLSLFNSSSFVFPAKSLGFTIFWVRFLRMWLSLNPTIEVVTFHLCGWCMLGVFLLPAFTCLGHEC